MFHLQDLQRNIPTLQNSNWYKHTVLFTTAAAYLTPKQHINNCVILHTYSVATFLTPKVTHAFHSLHIAAASSATCVYSAQWLGAAWVPGVWRLLRRRLPAVVARASSGYLRSVHIHESFYDYVASFVSLLKWVRIGLLNKEYRELTLICFLHRTSGHVT